MKPGLAAVLLLIGGCATRPPADFTIGIPPGVVDARGRFGEIYCTVIEQRGETLLEAILRFVEEDLDAQHC